MLEIYFCKFYDVSAWKEHLHYGTMDRGPRMWDLACGTLHVGPCITVHLTGLFLADQSHLGREEREGGYRMNNMIRVTCSAFQFSAAISIDVCFLVILQKGSHISVNQSASMTVAPHCTRYRLDACLKTGNSCRIVHSILSFCATTLTRVSSLQPIAA